MTKQPNGLPSRMDRITKQWEWAVDATAEDDAVDGFLRSNDGVVQVHGQYSPRPFGTECDQVSVTFSAFTQVGWTKVHIVTLDAPVADTRTESVTKAIEKAVWDFDCVLLLVARPSI